jgi:bacteriorhodopsin
MGGIISFIGPRILIPGFFLGPKLSTMNDPVVISQTIAVSFLFISFAFLLFSDTPWISLIPGIAAWAYWHMLRDETNIDYYRYIDWSLTTPLMLLALFVANKLATIKIIGLISLDLFMITMGYFGSKESDSIKRNVLFGLGCLALLPILYQLFKAKKAKYAIYLTLILWTLYPIVWYLDESKVITKTFSNTSYSFMDLVAKVGLVNLLHI